MPIWEWIFYLLMYALSVCLSSLRWLVYSHAIFVLDEGFSNIFPEFYILN